MLISEIQEKIHNNATRQGVHGENEPSEIEYRCRIIEGILGAYRAFDEGTPPAYFSVANGEIDAFNDPKEYLEFLIARDQSPKPEGFAVALVDVAIRCFDCLEEKGINYVKRRRPVKQDPNLFLMNLLDPISSQTIEVGVDIVVSKILSFFNCMGWDFRSILALKMRYNDTIPYHHGTKGNNG